jgi:aspartate/methionine/tyrosine aminotransferase
MGPPGAQGLTNPDLRLAGWLAGCPAGEPVEAFCDRLVEEAGVLLLPATVYDHPEGRFRLGFGRRNLPECLQQLDGFLAKHYA